MRYIIYGAGAIGGVIGAHLHNAGFETVLIARGAHFAAMQARGLRINSGAGSVTYPMQAVGHPSEIEFRDDDCVFMTMKSQDTLAALDHLRLACGGRELPIVCAQNGVANERMALRRFERVYGMLVILPATYLEPGIVEASSTGVVGVLDAGRYPSGVDDLITRVSADLESARFRARPDRRVMRLKYAKLLSNLNNTLQAALGDARAPDISRMLVAEAVACYEAAGIEWAPEDEMRALRRGMLPVGGRQGSSTWQSLARGAGSIESDYLNGEIVLLGRLHGVSTPANAAIQRIGMRLIAEGRPPGSMTPEEVMREVESLSLAGSEAE
jgi:2-dehydropantoate 2-reductase